MTVTELPHQGTNVQIEVNGRQTVFGYTANDNAVRPSTQPDGSEWADDDNTGWSLANGSLTATVADLIRANRHALGENPQNRRFRLEVSPEIAATLRVQEIYGVNNLLAYTDGADYVDIPLVEDEVIGDDVKETRGSNWYRRGYVDYIRVLPATAGAKLVELS
jgi:hypothetical protein